MYSYIYIAIYICIYSYIPTPTGVNPDIIPAPPHQGAATSKQTLFTRSDAGPGLAWVCLFWKVGQGCVAQCACPW